MFDITDIVVALVGAILGAATVWITLRKASSNTDQDIMLGVFVEAACLAAEKLFSGKARGAEKLSFVLKMIEAETAKLGIRFDAYAVTKLVEEFVADMNKEKDVES